MLIVSVRPSPALKAVKHPFTIGLAKIEINFSNFFVLVWVCGCQDIGRLIRQIQKDIPSVLESFWNP